jgi:hypothetical protein
MAYWGLTGFPGRSGNGDGEGKVAGVVLGEGKVVIRIGGVVADVSGGRALTEGFGFVVGHGGAMEITAVVIAVEDEVEGGFELVAAGEGAGLFGGLLDLPCVDLGGGEGPALGGRSSLLGGFAVACGEERV